MSAQIGREEALELVQDLSDRLDSVESQNEALRQAVRLQSDDNDELREEVADLRERVAQLESTVTPDPEAKPYNQKSRDEKVREVRVALARKALGQKNGKARFDYTDVLSLFGNHPSSGHAYTLMELAGNLDGFEFGTFHDQKRLRVNLDAVNDDAVLHAANNDGASEVN
ncbi:hypothetical protein [Halomarina litorea]|uniref:hypothetical protein n=1 Tax=Halomarina litorea TaxID=2961595 RepID=UPI0020C1DB77|nr:hypothetical protein [Halomarina sp. BCD28]